MTLRSASAKVVLGGEHAVVYGRPALAVPLPDLPCAVEVSAAKEGVTIRSDQFLDPFVWHRTRDPRFAFLDTALRLAEREMGALPSLQIEVRSAIPVGCGLGSSAAVLVGVLGGVFEHLGMPLTDDRLLALGHEAEMEAHGRSSGLDVAAVVHCQPLRYQPGTPIRPLTLGAPLDLIVATSGRPSSTREVVLAVAEKLAAQDRAIAPLFDGIGSEVDRMEVAIRRGDRRALGKAMDRNHALLRELGVSDPSLERLIAAARQSGALGAKLTGAGRGGCVVALAAEGALEPLCAALREAGAPQVFPLRLSVPQPRTGREAAR